MQSGDTIEAAGEGKNGDINGSVAEFKEACWVSQMYLLSVKFNVKINFH